MKGPFSRSVMKQVSARVALAALLCASIAFATHAKHASATAGAEVSITRFTFAPKEITVAPGTKIVWTNRDETPHTVTSNDKAFASKGLDTDDTYEHTFDGEGDFAYICTVHPFMTGVVHVRKQ
ncbi:MAG TPA: cupredoxin family copper-binding protein [Casimicrobiaceae bacterium]|nr:cupredoxin family copper-binding protein [Casimicrobiaceae bacterium]